MSLDNLKTYYKDFYDQMESFTVMAKLLDYDFKIREYEDRTVKYSFSKHNRQIDIFISFMFSELLKIETEMSEINNWENPMYDYEEIELLNKQIASWMV